MIDPTRAPVTYDAANRWLAGRTNVPTRKGSRELALDPGFQPKAKAQAFFSAKVGEARVLEKLREVSDAYTRGEVNLAQARSSIKSWLAQDGRYQPDDVARAKTPPAGVSEEEWLARRGIGNIASTARLNLILGQNAAMAAAVGRREFDLDPDMVEREPYWRYIAVQDGRARDSHAALHNLVLPKSDPFWDTHTPPWEFNCRCAIEGCDEEEAKALGVGKARPDGEEDYRVLNQGRALNVSLPQTGFVFDAASAFETLDLSSVAAGALRQAVAKSIAKYLAANKAAGKIKVTGESA